MNLPNAITVGRLVLIPVFVWLSYSDGGAATFGAFAVFVTASLSDFVDGYLARRQGTVSRLGKFLDPTVDKLLVVAALFVLVSTRSFPLWAAVAIVLREVAVQLLRIQIVTGGGDLPASAAGKLKTLIQIVMVSWWLLFPRAAAVHWLLLVAALATTYWSGLEYFVRARRVTEAAA